ncbi:hypothetical protein [Bradyrhizobium yuanmingense]|uniref:hypothetical protein n=1 Tax=Bradyrhizobium yuanmingense TaxID=108015 RepID=UPI0023B9DF8D|nr:hypothetical protein [Bradyrhizobium yuanmingense]MDF0583113.1 hypothetical protein [Bradyrhizobium yuanmingense]
MHKVFPHLDQGKPVRFWPTPQASLPEAAPCPPPLPFAAIVRGRWEYRVRQLRALRRTGHARLLVYALGAQLTFIKLGTKVIAKLIGGSATLISVVAAIVFASSADGTDIKASETHLAAAQIIGAALALVLSLSIIPAQRAAELFSIVVLKFFARDRALLSGFLVLVATTISSLLLGTRWSASLDAKTSLCIQFVLLGLSFDALRRFYVSTLDLLAPESAIRRIVKESLSLSRTIGTLAEKTVAVQVAATGAPSEKDRLVYAQAIIQSRLPHHLLNASSQLQEFAHRFIARRDSNATIETINALETLAADYADLRRNGLTLHLDPEFLLSGPQSDVSDVLGPTYESIHHIIEDAISAKNERVVRHGVQTLGRLTLHAMSISARREHGDTFAPLAFGAAFHFDRSVRAVLAAGMPDATLDAIRSLDSILQSRKADIDTGSLTDRAIETLFAIAVDGYIKSSGVNVFRAVEAILRSLASDIELDVLEERQLKSVLQRILQLLPAEIAADATGSRSLQVFPAYDLGFEACIPMLIQAVARKAEFDPERAWNDPYSDLSEFVDVVRDHYRRLSALDFRGTLLKKWVVDSLDAVSRVLLHEIANTSAPSEFIETVADDLKPMVTWVSGFFKAKDGHKQHHLSDATSQLAILGMHALGVGRHDIAEKCGKTLQRIAGNLAGQISPYELADLHMDIETLARASDALGSTVLSGKLREMITLPAQFSREEQDRHLDARKTRERQLEEALSQAGRRPYNADKDPVECLFAFQAEQKKKG